MLIIISLKKLQSAKTIEFQIQKKTPERFFLFAEILLQISAVRVIKANGIFWASHDKNRILRSERNSAKKRFRRLFRKIVKDKSNEIRLWRDASERCPDLFC